MLTSLVSPTAKGKTSPVKIRAWAPASTSRLFARSATSGGAATGSFTVNGNFTDVFRNHTLEIGREIENVTKAAADQLTDAIKGSGEVIVNEFKELIYEGDTDFTDIDWPTVDLDFDVDLAPLPEVKIGFVFEDDFELYLKLNTKISAASTYELNLFSSKDPSFGFSEGGDITAGLAVVIDLIIELDAEADISSGFHMKFDKGVGAELVMFSRNISDFNFNGGKFEFLPVTLSSPTATIKAVLRVALKAGLEFKQVTKQLPKVKTKDDKPLFGAGVVAEVVAHVAEFSISVTGPTISTGDENPGPNRAARRNEIESTGAVHPGSSSSLHDLAVRKDEDEEEEECKLKVEAFYTFALAVAAGATIEALGNTWGPSPNSSIPVFHTQIGAFCATLTTPTATVTATTTAGLEERRSPRLNWLPRMTSPPLLDRLLGRREEELVTTTISSTATFFGQICKSPGLVNCPVSLQESTTMKSVMTLVTVVPDGVIPTFPATQMDSVSSIPEFGPNVHKMISSVSGPPTSYNPSATDEGFLPKASEAIQDVKDFLDKDTNGVSNKVILGVSLGLGIPVLIGVIAGLVHLIRRKRYSPVPSRAPVRDEGGELPGPMPYKKEPVVTSTEVHPEHRW
ncbi:unnamed protein product [Sordaria macrospora k-hell]|uniref:WGS project CABT00000000 data, contig 2.30 n=1 Tax=Sordaria macrospora (strain ATCC MYA-333 / DSM 997 / K(L3346) / K-hell) TaxID=771870 RepID=F7W597_SORMK|nr:uncharacterized protein SMAC_05645 [Sordaria macrospora k-hell]CCC12685.1 unnamed protein product [Sordaria macrospora k-hell]